MQLYFYFVQSVVCFFCFCFFVYYWANHSLLRFINFFIQLQTEMVVWRVGDVLSFWASLVMTSSRIHRIFHTKSDRFNKSQLWLKRFVPIRARQTSIRATRSEALKQNNQVNELFYVLLSHFSKFYYVTNISNTIRSCYVHFSLWNYNQTFQHLTARSAKKPIAFLTAN